MIKSPRPTSVLTIQFEHGGLVIHSNKTKAQLIAMMKDEVIILGHMDIKLAGNPETKKIEYLIVNEEIHIDTKKAKILFFSIAETEDPPKIDTTAGGLVDPTGRKIM